MRRGFDTRGFHTPPEVLARLLLLLSVVVFASQVYGQVTFDRLLNSSKEPQNWLTYSGDYSGRRFSALDQINITNARSLTAQWVYQTGATVRDRTR